MPTTPPLPTLKPRGFLRGTEFLHETFFMQSPDPTIAMTLVSLEDAQAAILADRRSRAPEGLSVAQEPKYTVNGSAIVNRASGEAIPADEPVFIFRARDRHAREAIEAYACVLIPGQHRDAVVQRVADFAAFSCAHPERMKEPDTAAPDATPTEPELPLHPMHEVNTHANALRGYIDGLSGDAFQGAIRSLGALRGIIDGLRAAPVAVPTEPAARVQAEPVCPSCKGDGDDHEGDGEGGGAAWCQVCNGNGRAPAEPVAWPLYPDNDSICDLQNLRDRFADWKRGLTPESSKNGYDDPGLRKITGRDAQKFAELWFPRIEKLSNALTRFGFDYQLLKEGRYTPDAGEWPFPSMRLTAPTLPQPAETAAEGEAVREEVATLRVSQWPTGREWSVDADEDMLQRLTAGSYRLSVIAVPGAALPHPPIAAPAGEAPMWTEDQIADACVAAEIPDSKFQSLVLALPRSEK